MTKRFKGRVVACLLALLPASAYAQDTQPAQDVGTGTPPELRDFRLDQPPSRPGPEQQQPQPEEPAVSPPPLAPTVERQPPSPPRPTTRREQAQEQRGTVSGEILAPATRPVVPEPAVESETTQAPSATEAAPTSGQAAPASTGRSEAPAIWFWLGGGLALLAILIAAAAFWRKRRIIKQSIHEIHDAPTAQPSPPVRLDKSASPPLPVGDRPGLKDAPPDGNCLKVQFAPSSAQLSIASLTVTGRLTVENRLGAAATDLTLRSQMISAQDGQRDAVEAFHANKADGEIQPLGELAAGERIDAIIEIRLPRTELHAFRWSEREFVAPIVLVNVAGLCQGQPVETRLSQLIGREGAEPSARMKPLAIDRGPKRFSSVDARPVFA